jgi:hypothetical protein
MFSKTKVVLLAAIVLSVDFPACFPAWAATKHHRASRVDPRVYNAVPNTSGECSPVHPPLCSNICTGSGPCAPPDGW